jgi:drug/metabolite transporter (DMT)-like permease
VDAACDPPPLQPSTVPQVTAILGGLGAALMFSVGTLCSSRSSRMIGAFSVLAWVMLTGLAINLVGIAVVGPPHDLAASTVTWMVVAGAGNVVGLALTYTALRNGKVGLVAPITSTEGAIAAVVAVLAGEPLGVASALLLAFIVAGVLLAAAAPEELPVEGERKGLAASLASAAALAFGVSLYATGHISTELTLPWVLLPPRLIGVVAVTIPLAVTRNLRLTRKAVPLVVAAGLAEVLGFTSYTIGARQDVAVAAVLVSQFAAISGVGAYLLFRERLTRLQLVGVAVIIVGVAALSVVRA